MSVFRISLLLGAVVCLPFLGSVGLWDPWETHYAEVGRQMLSRADLVHPYWQNAWFFSKPPLVPWLAALGLFVSGAQPWGAWKRVRTIPAWSPLLTLIISAPWYVTMSLFTERDDEGRRFVERFFGYDHLDRLVSGVHSTTPGGTFTYFLEQGAFAIAAGLISVLRHDARALVATMLSLAAVIALALSWHHWPALGAHWTQRELTRAYFDTRRPDEPLGAFLMNWKGETFYTRNEVLQLSARDPRAELSALAQRPGRAFVIVEHARVPMVRSLLPAQRITPLTTPPNNKFTVLTLDD